MNLLKAKTPAILALAIYVILISGCTLAIIETILEHQKPAIQTPTNPEFSCSMKYDDKSELVMIRCFVIEKTVSNKIDL